MPDAFFDRFKRTGFQTRNAQPAEAIFFRLLADPNGVYLSVTGPDGREAETSYLHHTGKLQDASGNAIRFSGTPGRPCLRLAPSAQDGKLAARVSLEHEGKSL